MVSDMSGCSGNQAVAVSMRELSLGLVRPGELAWVLAKEARGLGIGKTLMQQCIVSAKEHGYKKLYLESMPHFSKAVSIYNKLGFRKLLKPLGNSGHTTCNIWMLLDL